MLRRSSSVLALATTLSAIALWTACGSSDKQQNVADSGSTNRVQAIAQAAAKEVGVVGATSSGKSGTPVLLLEETHNSRASQIQHAIVFTRLYAKEGLRDIALEGYLQERPKIDAAWFTKRWANERTIERARVAVRLLKEGEISAAEFAKLTYADLALHPIEIGSQYNVRFTERALDAVMELAQKISPSRAEEVSKKLERAIQGDALSAEEQLDIAEGLERDRVSKRITLSPQTLEDWQSWLAFWRGRAGGNKTMLDATLVASNTAGAQLITMNIGAAHTEGLCGMLKKAGRPFAVVTPLALKNKDKRGDIDKNYERKEQRLSLQSDGFFMAAIGAATAKAKKPEPVISPEPWLEVKALTYQFTHRIANVILGPPSPPNGGKPPFGFANDEFRGPLVFVDPSKIAIVPDDPKRDRKAVLFPVVLNPGNPS